MKTVLKFSGIGNYRTDLSTGVLSYYKLGKDLVEKKVKTTRLRLALFICSVLQLQAILQIISKATKNVV